jgi:sec-independent protein translocase protein TatC
MVDLVDRARAALTERKDQTELPGMSLIEHLNELRQRLVHSAVALVMGFFVAYAFHEKIFGYMQAPIVEALKKNHLDTQLVIHNPIDGFNMYLKISFTAGRFWRRPTSSISCGCSFRRALRQRERNTSRRS